MQTAEVIAASLDVPGGVAQMTGLGPLDDVKMAAEAIAGSAEDILVVGHLPHLSKLAAHLICGDESRQAVDFRMGGIVALSRDERGWSFGWMITPETVPE